MFVKMPAVYYVAVICMLINVARARDSDEELLRRIEALELRDRIQQDHIDQQDKLVKKYENELQKHTERIKHLEEQLENTAKERSNVEEFDDKVQDKTESTKADLPSKMLSGVNEGQDKADHTKGIDLPSKGFTGLNGRNVKYQERKSIRRSTGRAQFPRLILDNAEGPVAFHATHDTGITNGIGKNQNILFEDIHLNLGNAFHPLHGLFVTPKSGIYLFSTSIMTAPGQPQIQATIVKNGSRLAKAYATGGSGVFDQGSVTIVTQLSVGDEVWVLSHAETSTSDYGDEFTSFMGVLLTEI